MLRNSINTVCRSVAMFVRACLFVGMLGASAFDQRFHYRTSGIVHRDIDVCKICHGIDCLEMDNVRCKYYMETDKLLQETIGEQITNSGISVTIDDRIHAFVARGAEVSIDCIPLMSSYTDCHKDNICTGCTKCACDGFGLWKCSKIQKCRRDPNFYINHRVLLTVMENLVNYNQRSRLKRSVQSNKEDVNTTKIGFKDVSEWLFEVQPLVDQLQRTTTDKIDEHNVSEIEVLTKAPIWTENITTSFKNPYTIIDRDYLAFDEVFNSIAVESKNYSRKKLLPDPRNDSFFGYMLFDEYNEPANDLKAKDELFVTTNDLAVESDMTESNNKGVTEVVIDLLAPSENYSNNDQNNITDYMEDNENNNYLDPDMESNSYSELNAANIMKRDVVTKNSSKLQEHHANEDDNNTNGAIELRDDILLPLSNLINAKQKELEDLLRIYENLIKFMKLNKTEYNNTDLEERDDEIDSNSSFNVYKLEIGPEFDYSYDIRQTDSNVLQKILYKFKLDVYEVIKDIITVQKLRSSTQMPQDLRVLIGAMKSYVRGQKNYTGEENMRNFNENGNFRRIWGDEKTQYPNSIVEGLIGILELVDKNNPSSNALAPLSKTSKKILQRVIKQNYVNEFTNNGLRIFDRNYNLTNDLQSIGLKWQEMTKHLTKSTVFDRLYALKLLHFVLSSDIEKMMDALTLINFEHSRRMLPIDGPIGNRIIKKINKGLKAINDKIKLIIKIHNNKRVRTNNSTKSFKLNKEIQKESFLKKIRNVLRNSKKDIVNLLKRKTKKSDLVKELARQKLDDITRKRFAEFEETMKKWQNNLNLSPREKRSLTIKYKNRIKNILPKYLRGKVNPAIVAKDTKKVNLKQNMKIALSNKVTKKTAKAVVLSSKSTSKKRL